MPHGGKTGEEAEAAEQVMRIAPLPGDVRFVAAGAGGLAGAALLDAERALLSAQASAKRIAEFTLGRGCARAALAKLDPALAGQAILRRGDRAPDWPEGVVGAITHHGGWAAAAVARTGDYRGLGLDLEAVRTPSEGLLRRILRPEEQEALQRAPSGEQALRFMLTFSAKEAVFKALHPLRGVYLGFQEASVLLPNGEMAREGLPSQGALTWRLEVDYGPDLPRGFEGEGGFATAGDTVLAGVWLRA